MNEEGRRAVVTGAARGIGRAVAQRLLAEGVAVLAVDLDEAGLAPLAGAGAATLAADVASDEGCARIVEAGSGADYLVNAAGIIRLLSIFETSRDDWRAIMTVNAESIFFLCQQLGPRLRDGGAIVNLSSSSAKLAATTETAAYAASKTAILSITRSFAYALAPRGIRVNAICPGIVETPMQEQVLEDVARLRGITAEELADRRTAAVPLGRGASPEECAGAIWFLLAGDSGYMTGEAMNFSGGLAMS
jgi:NAD(P)-dependent dehydrogenase (short-subunit alcohol dehydrogenase family)